MNQHDTEHRQYERNQPLAITCFDADPLRQFQLWFDEARAAGVVEPAGMTLSTCTPEGRPSARIVLFRGFYQQGFCFYTNYESRKGAELAANPHAALTFWWDKLERCVRVEGVVERLPEKMSDDYFAGRPRGSQLGAAVSRQSQPLERRSDLEQRLAVLEEECPGAVPRPTFWGGYRVVPHVLEFWQGRRDRLHDRVIYARAEAGWTRGLLQP